MTTTKTPKTPKAPKIFKIKKTTFSSTYFQEGTLEELISAYSYTLGTGRSWEHEKGNKKINCKPTTIKSLITNLNNAVNNSAANGYSNTTYSLEN